MDDEILIHIKNIRADVVFGPYSTWVPDFLKGPRDAFVADPYDASKLKKYVVAWFRFWNPWSGNADTSKFHEGWYQKGKWSFAWNIGFTKCRMWSTCIRFEEVMICWSLFILYLKEVCDEQLSAQEKAIIFGKCCTVMDHLIKCVGNWNNIDESHMLLSEFNVTTMKMWREICFFMCHFLVLKQEGDLQSLRILCSLESSMSFRSLASVKTGSAGIFFDSRNIPLSKLDILCMLIREKLSIHILMMKSDISLEDYNDIMRAESYMSDAVDKKRHVDKTFNGLVAYTIQSLQGPDEAEEKLKYVKNLKSKLISSIYPKESQLNEHISKTEIPKLNISFPDFILHEDPTNQN